MKKSLRQKTVKAVILLYVLILICVFSVGCKKHPSVFTTSDEGYSSVQSGGALQDNASSKKNNTASDADTSGAVNESDQTLTDEEFNKIIQGGEGKIEVQTNPSHSSKLSLNNSNKENTGSQAATSSQEKDEETGQDTSSKNESNPSSQSPPQWDSDGDGFYDIEVH